MLTVNAIRRTFNPGTPNEVRALQGVTLTIPTASFVVVIGTNGSGKSTLLNALAGTFLVDEGSSHWRPPHLHSPTTAIGKGEI